jgi:hypothetical protein
MITSLKARQLPLLQQKAHARQKETHAMAACVEDKAMKERGSIIHFKPQTTSAEFTSQK